MLSCIDVHIEIRYVWTNFSYITNSSRSSVYVRQLCRLGGEWARGWFFFRWVDIPTEKGNFGMGRVVCFMSFAAWNKSLIDWLIDWIGQRNVTYRKNVALRCGRSIPTAEWLDSSALQTGLVCMQWALHIVAHAAGKCILCREGWWRGSSKMTLGRTCYHYDTSSLYKRLLSSHLTTAMIC